jgi:hypothetical protein
MSNTEFVPLVGCRASYKNKQGLYVDTTVVAKSVRRNLATIQLESGDEVNIKLTRLERPLLADVNERFEYFRQLTELTLKKKLYSLIVSGEGGIGKSFTIAEMIEYMNMIEGEDYVYVKGYSTAKALFQLLEKNKEKTVIFDDIDNILNDAIGQNILKGVLDTSPTRKVQWMTNDSDAEFTFTGSAIFLTNKNKDKIPQALISRSLVIDLYMSNPEKIERLRHLIPTIPFGLTLTVDEKVQVLDVIQKYQETIHDLNVRTFIKGLVVYEETKDINIVRHQILQ